VLPVSRYGKLPLSYGWITLNRIHEYVHNYVFRGEKGGKPHRIYPTRFSGARENFSFSYAIRGGESYTGIIRTLYVRRGYEHLSEKRMDEWPGGIDGEANLARRTVPR